jgi:hypothetical protein
MYYHILSMRHAAGDLFATSSALLEQQAASAGYTRLVKEVGLVYDSRPGEWAPSAVSSSTVGEWAPSADSSSTLGEWAPSVVSSSTVGEWAPSAVSADSVLGLYTLPALL